MTFSETMMRLRLDANITQEMLAKKLGVSLQDIQDWEGGKRYPCEEVLYALASHLWVDTQELRALLPR